MTASEMAESTLGAPQRRRLGHLTGQDGLGSARRARHGTPATCARTCHDQTMSTLATAAAADAVKGRSRLRFAAMIAIGVVVGGAAGLFGAGLSSIVIGWAAACLSYLVWVWLAVGRLSGEQTRQHATREDPSRPTSHLLLIVACTASLAAVATLVVSANRASGAEAGLLAGLAVVSVALSWFLVHTLFMLRYAVLYYSGTAEGGIDFNQPEPPDYADFAYLAFDLGMTFQVSDTTVSSSAIRHVVLRHCLLSYLFGTVILATLINLVAGLGS